MGPVLGQLVAAPGEVPRINTSGNGMLATGGTGDVLAGLTGALLANGKGSLQAACEAVYRHGAAADQWTEHHTQTLTAGALAGSF